MTLKDKRYLISFATVEFHESQQRLKKSAYAHGVDKVFEYSQQDIRKTTFYRENRSILDQRRGAGYWLWKPYLLLETLKKVPEESIVVYSDAGIEIIRDLEPLFTICKKNSPFALFSNAGHLNRTWTKRDCFVLMDCDTEEYWNGQNILASFHLWRKCEKSLSFLEQWLSYSRDPRVLTDIANQCRRDNFPEFIEHRHDQSVLSILAIRWGLEIYRDPTQWGNPDKLEEYREPGEFLHNAYTSKPFRNSPYSTLLNHHREKKVPYWYRMQTWLYQMLRISR